MGARQLAQAQREAKVLAAARELFTSQGYDATSMRQIAERAGVSVGTVANTGDKASLLASLFGPPDHLALMGRLTSAELGSARPATSFADEVDDFFADWYHRIEGEPELVSSYLLTLCSAGAAGSDQARRQREEDEEVVKALGRRLMARHPGMELDRVEMLAYACYSSHVVAIIAVVIGNLSLQKARERAHRTVASLTANL